MEERKKQRKGVLEMQKLGNTSISGTWMAAYVNREHTNTVWNKGTRGDTDTRVQGHICWITEYPIYAKT